MPSKKTSKKSATKKTAGKKTAASKKTTKKAATTRKRPVKPAPGPAEQRYRMIAEAAYYLAEKDGFTGDSFNYWIAAERQIDMQLEQGR